MNSASKTLRIALLTILIVAAAPAVHGQQIVRLLEFTNVWKFNDSGADLGTAWREPTYDDSAWLSGPGLLGVETNLPPPYPVAIQTPMSNGPSTVITYYLRSHFPFQGQIPSNAVLRAKVFLDDGCAIYLNGVEAGRIRLGANANYLSTASPGAPEYAAEGSCVPIELSPELLVAGDNVFAVEVHQAGPFTVDVVFGMRLELLIPEPLVITRQPEDQVSIVEPSVSPAAGSPAFFRVDFTGSPASFQWRKNGTNLLGAEYQVLNLPAPQLNDAGDYSVIVSNALGEVASSTARLTFIDQNSTNGGPKMVSATVRIASTSNSNQIDVKFSEKLNLTAGTINHSGFTVSEKGTSVNVPITVAQYSFPVIRLTTAERLSSTKSYYVTASGVRDLSGNFIAPNSQIGVTWPITVRVVDTNSRWHYHARALEDYSILDGNWFAADFVESPWWEQGSGLFATGIDSRSNCISPATTLIPNQKPATLFRVPFVWPADLTVGRDAVLRFRSYPAVAFWLNGEELFRQPDALPPPPFALDVNSRASRGDALEFCVGFAIPFAKILPGTNWLAAATFQTGESPGNGTSFGATLDVTYLVTGSVPQSPPPQLMASPVAPGQYQLSWTGGGYALETATNIVTVGTNTVVGPWIEVPDMANPYTVTVNPDEPLRLFRLSK
jgi:Bacterial Ig-like domain